MNRLVAIGLLSAFSVFAQTNRGAITGTITDPKGLAMVGVNVLVHNEDTGVDHAPVTTNDQGVYNVPLLQPGNYDITASQTGFSTVKRAMVALQVGATARIDIVMPVSAQQTLVTVTTELPLLETEKTELQTQRDELTKQRDDLMVKDKAAVAALEEARCSLVAHLG